MTTQITLTRNMDLRTVDNEVKSEEEDLSEAQYNIESNEESNKETFQDLVKSVRQKCPKILRTATWNAYEDPQYNAEGSCKVGGDPYRIKNFTWPICDCGEKKHFIFQLNFADVPQEMQILARKSSGLLQCFGCSKCIAALEIPDLRDFEAFKFIPAEDLEVPSLQVLAAKAVPDASKAPKPIVDLLQGYNFEGSSCCNTEEEPLEYKDAIKELPCMTELVETSGFQEVINETGAKIYDIEARNVEYNGVLMVGNGASHLKMGGYPGWPHGVEYPDCKDCHLEMDITLLSLRPQCPEIDSMWVFLCPECKAPCLSYYYF